MITRRAMLSKLLLGVAGVASGAVPFRLGNTWTPFPSVFSPQDDSFLEELERASFRLFLENAHPRTGLVKDRIQPGVNEINAVSSIAATGFGLTALCIGEQRGWIGRAEATGRVLRTLRFLHDEMPNVRGFYHHFVDWENGRRAWLSEVSSIDTAILLCGVLTCRQHFDDAEIRELAEKINDRADWRWLYRNGPFVSHGWTPERGFLVSQWDSYSEHMMIYLLGIGANKHPLPAESWHAWSRPWANHGGLRYIEGNAPLFIHQYSHAWFDFRDVRDEHANYFENSTLATKAHRRFCIELRNEFPHYSNEFWGVTASESPHGYAIWGGPPRQGTLDGTIVPCAPGGSLPFEPQNTIQVLQNMRERSGKSVWTQYGFTDAFNPATGWVSPTLVSINTGITLLMAENARSGFVWKTFMRNPEVQSGMQRAGFRPETLVLS